MKIKEALLFAALLSASVYPAKAQQGNLGDEQINVVKPYQPTLSDAFKISDIPGRDTAVAYTPDMNYDVREVQHQTVYTITPIKPVRIRDENIKKLYKGYVRAGYGTKNTPYAEIFYNSLRSKIFDAGIHLNHFSSTGKIKGYGKPGMRESGLRLFGTRFFDNSRLSANIGYQRSVYHWYGFLSPPDIFSASETRHSFNDIYGSFAFRSNDKNKETFRYSAGIDFYNFSDNKANDENNAVLTATAGKLINDLDISGELVFDFLQHETEFTDQDKRSIVRFSPRIVRTFDNLKLTAGANAAIEINDLTKYHLYPHARIDYTLISESVSVYGQLTGNLERNSWKGFTRENPFLANSVILENTNNKLDLSAGVYAKIDRQFAFIASAGIKRLKNDAFYNNYNGLSTMVLYDVFYDDNTSSKIHAELVYDQGEKINISVGGDYYGNDVSSSDKPLFLPSYRLTLNGAYNIADKIYISTLWSYTGKQYALNSNLIGDRQYISMKGYIDGNLSVDYRYSKVLSVFVNLNNITASKYARWYQYPSYRFSAMAGVSYSF